MSSCLKVASFCFCFLLAMVNCLDVICSEANDCSSSLTQTCEAGDECNIICSGSNSCGSLIIESNFGTKLNVSCSGTDSCQRITINCQSTTNGCIIKCTSIRTCKQDSSLTCGTGDCTIECSGGGMVCNAMTVNATLSSNYTCTGNGCTNIDLFTANPSLIPTSYPSIQPTSIPTYNPTSQPTKLPTYSPSALPTLIPSNTPSFDPTNIPSIIPTIYPTTYPTSYSPINLTILLLNSTANHSTVTTNIPSNSSSEYLPTNNSQSSNETEIPVNDRNVNILIFDFTLTALIIGGSICICICCIFIIFFIKKRKKKLKVQIVINNCQSLPNKVKMPMINGLYNNIGNDSPDMKPQMLNNFPPLKMANESSMDLIPEIAAAAAVKVEKRETVANFPPKSIAIENDNLLIMDGNVIDDDHLTTGGLVMDDENENNDILNVKEMDNYDIDSKINTDLDVNDGENESTDEDESNDASEGRDEINEESKNGNIVDQQIDVDTQGYANDNQLLVHESVDDGIGDNDEDINTNTTDSENIQKREDDVSVDFSNHESDDEIIHGIETVS